MTTRTRMPPRPAPRPGNLSSRSALAVLALTLAACGGPGAAGASGGDDPAAGIATGAATAVADAETNGMSGHGGHDAHGGRPDLGADEPSDFSIYHAGSFWTDQSGTERQLESLRGKVRVVAMVYTSCAYACPRIIMDMKRIEGEIPPGSRDDVGFVLVTIDPERDTPERLATFARGSRLDQRWTLLTGTEDDILELAALLGVQYRETAPGEFVHSNLITVLDADGRVVHRQLGLGTDPAATLTVIQGLAG